jgi:hypothetical protein
MTSGTAIANLFIELPHLSAMPAEHVADRLLSDRTGEEMPSLGLDISSGFSTSPVYVLYH